jgi:flagellar biosynthesis/type III secretory pathway protein FliH
MQIIRESPLYQELMIDLDEARAQARARGLEEGREQGLEEGREAALQILRRFLIYRFQIAETQFDEAFQWLDLADLKQLSDAMIDVATLADFEGVLQQLVAQAKEKQQQAENNHSSSSIQGKAQ